MTSPEEHIAEVFNSTFARFDMQIGASDVAIGAHREIRGGGWRILYRVLAEDDGAPSLEFYATHRMTDDRHARIRARGHLEELDAIHTIFGFDPKVPGAEEAAREAYVRHNGKVADELRAAGLYPEGDINAYLRTGGETDDAAPRARNEER